MSEPRRSGSGGIEAVLIDVGGTLWPDRPSVRVVGGAEGRRLLSKQEVRAMSARRVTRLVSLTRADALLLAERLATEVELPAEKQDTDAHVASVVDGLGWSGRGLDLLAIREAMCIPGPEVFDLFPGAADLLRGLRDAGLRCAVVSNTRWRSGDSYRRDFEHWGVANCIDAYITSLDVGYRKPNPAMFHAALEAVAVDAGAAVMIGDSVPNDVAPAQALGMRAVLVASERQPPEVCPADFVVGSLLDLAARSCRG